MDIKKLMDKLLKDKELEEIPFIYLYKIVLSLVEAISSGECFYEEEKP